jgi:hypothetical protein
VINGIESAIDRVVNQLPVGQSAQQDIRAAFVELLDRVVNNSAPGAATPPPATTPTVTATQLLPDAKTSGTGSTSLLTDATLPGLAQLSHDLTATDSAYNEREVQLRERLNLPELERRLRGYAESMGVEYSSTDLDGILRNAGYGAAHLGSSDRYMAAVEQFTGEAFENYRQRAGNVPGAPA